MAAGSGGTVGELGEFRLVDGLGHGAEEARCGLWCGSGKMIGAQSGVQGHLSGSCVLAPQKSEEGVQALDPVTQLPGVRDKKRIVDREIHPQADSVLESKCGKRF